MTDDRTLPQPLADHVKWIDLSSEREVATLLTNLQLLTTADAPVMLSPAGEGNMNVTLRAEAEASGASWIVKQSRPYVAKYDFIPAPIDRIDYERFFYEFIQQHSQLAVAMPRLLASVPKQHLIVLEDLGAASDLQSLYQSPQGQERLPDEICELFQWLMQLHQKSGGSSALRAFDNVALRKLNHQHIFDLPFHETAPLNLDEVCEGLGAASLQIRTDAGLRKKIDVLGQRYLGSGDCLLHGDYYPGSWLATERGVRVIDPEFCFAGPPEFDVGVMLAHLLLAGFSEADAQLFKLAEAAGYDISWPLAKQFAGVEILRRILGVAQLPMKKSLPELVELMNTSVHLVRSSTGS